MGCGVFTGSLPILSKRRSSNDYKGNTMTDYIIRGGKRLSLPDLVDPWDLVGDLVDFSEVEWEAREELR